MENRILNDECVRVEMERMFPFPSLNFHIAYLDDEMMQFQIKMVQIRIIDAECIWIFE